MRRATVYVNGIKAGILTELEFGSKCQFHYLPEYSGLPVSLTMPLSQKLYIYESFPPFFDGLLPEGFQLEGLLKYGKLDRNDHFSQLIAVGSDTVGNITVNLIQE